jgi:O-antigen/teichoic acid export membrane protein
MKGRIANLVLRAGGMLGRFMLVLFLARILPEADVGTYGLIAAGVAYVLYLLGCDFYSFAGREMARVDRGVWPTMLRDQLALYAISYAIVFPLIGLVFLGDLLPLEYCFAFYAITLLEHLSQESFRVLVVMGRPVAAGLILFVRTGGWCYVLIFLHATGVSRMSLESVFWAWAAANGASLACGVWLLRNLAWGARSRHIDWIWIRHGLGVALKLLLGSLALRGLFIMDRILIDFFSGRELLGVYAVYFSVTNSVMSFVDATVFSFRYPRLITLYKKGERAEFTRELEELKLNTIGISVSLGAVAGVMMFPVLYWIGKPLFWSELPAFFVLLAAGVGFCITHVPHYSLYAMGKDSAIVWSHVWGLLAFCLLGLLFRASGIMGVAIAWLCAVLLIGGLKHRKVMACRRVWSTG